MLRRVLRHPMRMGGQGHGPSHAGDAHSHGSKSALAEAYEHTEARLFGEHAHGERKAQDWEGPVYMTIFGVIALAAASYYRPSTNPNDWARDEAEERFRRRADGKPIEYGVNYAGVRYMKEHGAISAEEAERLESGAVARVR